ncbi:multiple sugar transport system permease protein [Microbacterium keratanolyticum]|uniref:ABC transporter permease n=1 Tax=Microbacterium keratanolyticum TaxID=67574 RepID=A0A9W6M7T4_9MICO|nr:carbohydrate ABC transporter permease [Microbacterium keratanolyticum]MBM7469110.1 multiple sugar transport system permease protein [Microbacterium keratanolyticum]GLK01190.1 ABC transporter permease [Microbacterium keratanolyticum]
MTTDIKIDYTREIGVVGRRNKAPRSVLRHGLLIGFGLVMLYPLIWMVGASFKESSDIFTEIWPFPDPVVLENYERGWRGSGVGFGTYFLNSTIVAVLSVVGNLFACTLAGYAFARLSFKFRAVFFACMMATLMLPHHVLMVPQYILFANLGWVNTFLPLITPKFLAVDAFFVFLMVQFLRGLPRELDEAAKIDGAGPWRTFWHVILPLTLPALATTSIFTFIWTWNDFLSPMIYLQDPRTYTVPLGLNSFLDASGDSAWGPMFAMAVLSLGPLFGFFLAGQKYLTTGIATTGLKG